jgi:hypothetical protein
MDFEVERTIIIVYKRVSFKEIGNKHTKNIILTDVYMTHGCEIRTVGKVVHNLPNGVP